MRAASASSPPRDSSTPQGSSTPSPVRRYRLSGRTIPLDPAVDAYRRDLADIALAGRITASHFAEPALRTAVRGADVRIGRETDAAVACRLEPGDDFAMLDLSGGVAWGYCVAGHRVGYVDAATFG